MLLEILIEHSAQKNDDDTKINPQHQQYHIGKTSVNRGKAAVVINIKRIEVGKNDPQKGRKSGARKFIPKVRFPVGNISVKQKKIYNKNQKGNTGAKDK